MFFIALYFRRLRWRAGAIVAAVEEMADDAWRETLFGSGAGDWFGDGRGGTLDIAYALIASAMRGGHPGGVLRFIAACVVGRGALKGGLGMEALGLAMHYCVAAVWATLFVLASLSVSFLRRFVVVSGVVYGLVIYAVMNLLVLPRTQLHVAVNLGTAAILNAAVPLVICVGLPVALINTRRCA